MHYRYLVGRINGKDGQRHFVHKDSAKKYLRKQIEALRPNTPWGIWDRRTGRSCDYGGFTLDICALRQTSLRQRARMIAMTSENPSANWWTCYCTVTKIKNIYAPSHQ